MPGPVRGATRQRAAPALASPWASPAPRPRSARPPGRRPGRWRRPSETDAGARAGHRRGPAAKAAPGGPAIQGGPRREKGGPACRSARGGAAGAPAPAQAPDDTAPAGRHGPMRRPSAWPRRPPRRTAGPEPPPRGAGTRARGRRAASVPAILRRAFAAVAPVARRRRRPIDRILETASLGPKRSIVVAPRSDGEKLVLGTSEAGISVLNRRARARALAAKLTAATQADARRRRRRERRVGRERRPPRDRSQP